MKSKQNAFITEEKVSPVDLLEGDTRDNNRFITSGSHIEQMKMLKTKVIMMSTHNLSYQKIERRKRQEIIGIDGATIIDSDGNLLAAGAILNITSGSIGGGRTAAAKCLSKYGIGIKISADGEISMFNKESTIHLG